MHSTTNRNVPDLSRLERNNLAPTGVHPYHKDLVRILKLQELQELQRQERLREVRKRRENEAAQKGFEAETAVAALVKAFKENRASKVGPSLAYARASWRVPEAADKEYISAKAVGERVEALWIQGKKGEARKVLRIAIDAVEDGPQRRSDQERDSEAYRLQQEQERARALEEEQSLASAQLSADAKMAWRMAGERSSSRVRPPTKWLTTDTLGGKATKPYANR